MDEKTLEALKGSIEKWERIVESPDAPENGPDNCPLCEEFLSYDCAGCPVRDATGFDGCLGSPYEEWETHQFNDHQPSIGRVPDCPECLRLAKAERDFLKSLLPEGA